MKRKSTWRAGTCVYGGIDLEEVLSIFDNSVMLTLLVWEKASGGHSFFDFPVWPLQICSFPNSSDNGISPVSFSLNWEVLPGFLHPLREWLYRHPTSHPRKSVNKIIC